MNSDERSLGSRAAVNVMQIGEFVRGCGEMLIKMSC